MNEFIQFLKVDLNWMWAVAALVGGALWVSTLMPTAARRKSVNPQQAVALLNGEAALIDVRDKNEFVQGHIPGARNVPMSQLEADMDKLPKNSPLILTCETGTKAQAAFKKLKDKGYSELYLLEGGIANWRHANMPIVKKG